MYSQRKSILLAILFGMLITVFSTAPTYAACTSVPSGAYPKTLAANTTYCLTSNAYVTAAGTNAFIIGGDNVSFDLGGFEIRNTAGGGQGIYATGRKNIVVKNGRISGFDDGFSFEGANEHIAIDGIVLMNTHDNIRVDGKAIVVRNCQIDGAGTARGITALGSGFTIINNDISEVGYEGIYMTTGQGVGTQNNVIENNRISSEALNPDSVGIKVDPTMNALVVNNRLRNMGTGVLFRSDGGGATGKYRDNLTTNCTTPFDVTAAVVDAGNNN